MKSMNGRFMKKLKFLKHGLVSEFNSSDKFLNQNLQIPSLYIIEDHKEKFTTSFLPNDRASAMDKFNTEVSSDITTEHDAFNETEKEIDVHLSLSHFEEKCPPGGSDSIKLLLQLLLGLEIGDTEV
ncbi:conserved hypothetical protein [Ricinus communis]|uniref:Uncharacterized protein n=1 Tax=Ricinus communis TaxID=3988 RepID=B9SDL1_RICCO|nr:conserved hypothetical protein [Ricinus communis]